MEEFSDAERYRFKRTLEELEDMKGQGTELLSVYIPPNKQISDVTAQLKDEMGSASNIKSKSTRTNVQSALSSVISRLKYYKTPPKNGMVIFCGTIQLGGDKTDMKTIIIEPPEPITSYSYQCSSEFYIEPLKDMLKDKKTYELLVLDRREATVGILKGKKVDILRHLTSNVPGKQRRGGQSSVRFSRLRVIAINEFYKRIGEAASEVYLNENLENFQGIFIGGPSPTKEDFVNGDYLHYELQQKILGVFDVAYTDESGIYELVDKLTDSIEGLEIAKDKKIVNRFLKEVIKEKGLATYGEEEVRRNLLLGSVDTLLLSEGLKKDRVTFKCNNCGREITKTVPYQAVVEAKTCECGSNMEIKDRVDLVEEMIDLAGATSTNVEIISSDSEEGAQFLNAFGGIAAILRYQTEG